MFRPALLALFTCLLVLSGGSIGQDKKEDKKSDPAPKVKGTLPANWGKLGLSDTQVQDIYKVRNKYNDEIAKLKAKITELETTRDKESKAILTPDQKKRLEEILLKDK
jgi:hypothetical protein